MSKAYQYTSDGYFAGEFEICESIPNYNEDGTEIKISVPLPNNATYEAPEEIEDFIPRWNGSAWEQVETHKGKEGYLDGQPHTIKEHGPLPEGWSDTPPLETARAAKIAAIDTETSAAILAGFDYEIDGQTLHFSYDTYDQQNFADTANASVLAKLGVSGVPASVTWNGWGIVKDADGKETSRFLIRLTLDPDSFLALYMGGALAHKAAQMEIGGQRKAAAEAATTMEELVAI